MIFNSTAGRRRLPINRLDADGVRDLLSAHGLNPEVVEASSEEEATNLVKAAVGRGDKLVVAAGGDGTIGTVARLILDSDVALGILPMGSVMNVPRMLELPTDLEQAAAVIAAGVTRRIDVGEANGAVFFENASVGMSAAIFREADRFQAGDRAGSVWRAIKLAFGYRPARMTIELDGGRVIRTRALMVSVSNGPYMGLGMTVAPGARIDDGKFDVRVFRRFSKFELIRHMGSIAYGRRAYSPHVLSERSASVHISGARPLPARADAMALGTTPLAVSVRPAALKMIVPERANPQPTR